ncbi:hypothetical protein DOM21_16560 [Bacteriovorax stolpii]|uniref:hypothetical protein n=1 Tax=Bacteriovorax stolpii TaxID=960 RepID=UPI0011573520|nr:hypothetical protein [Bacteriovorax stolpii]QDK43037.1 hypothetical protein DOM21_16560 [Bacteriovorax stolpii]
MKIILALLFTFSLGIHASELACQKTIEETESYTHCLNKYDFYPRPIHFFIPKNLNASIPRHLFVHFHGHNLNGYDHFKRTTIPGEGYGDYGYFLADSGASGILVIPESLGNCTSYDQYFSSIINTNLFFSKIKEMTSTNENIHLSGHSGAYRVLNRITGYVVANKLNAISKINSLGLFDATYGQVPAIEKWLQLNLKENNQFYFMNAFVSGEKATAEPISRELMKKYHDQRIDMLPIKSNKNESISEQHFMTLKRAGLTLFFQKIE